MSKRSRAVPWFLERPPYYVSERKLGPGDVAVWRDWSWDAKTWFQGDGTCLRPGFYLPVDRPPPDVLERYPLLVGFFSEHEKRARELGDKFLGEVIARAGVRA